MSSRSLRVVWSCVALVGLAQPAFAHEETHQTSQHAMHAEQTPWGIAGASRAVQREIRLSMSDDMRFSPDRFSVKRGETVRLIITNAGAQLHELVIGTPAALNEHAEMMRRFPTMEHAEAHMAHVPVGQSRVLVWRFNRAGQFALACLINGHFQAGMRGTIEVKS
ncbi:cupredoxin family protein [Uliginosibacterium sp. 31-16]|uniref:cupredoxin domain-containing protein n=1 Tax=Uliginosibacterium sp. 31-16 TaxID=3068315 RepID=UPI00273FA338|nr:cupredoxin family protein [Uliginosibacterium sp. 31-16]MDP5238754.1 cupredoxin family protein [Uliginosibacterium sp. 31-16]